MKRTSGSTLPRSLPRSLKYGALAAVLLGYAYFETHELIRGPVIALERPENGATLERALIELSGRAENISRLSLNGRQIYVDEAGHFSERLLLSYGYNILTVKAAGRFGRTRTEHVEVVYK